MQTSEPTPEPLQAYIDWNVASESKVMENNLSSRLCSGVSNYQDRNDPHSCPLGFLLCINFHFIDLTAKTFIY